MLQVHSDLLPLAPALNFQQQKQYHRFPSVQCDGPQLGCSPRQQQLVLQLLLQTWPVVLAAAAAACMCHALLRQGCRHRPQLLKDQVALPCCCPCLLLLRQQPLIAGAAVVMLRQSTVAHAAQRCTALSLYEEQQQQQQQQLLLCQRKAGSGANLSH
jgi:hypothetical protein